MSEPIRLARRACSAVVGDARLDPAHARSALAEELGRRLVDAGFRVVTAGMGGAMLAAHRGVRTSEAWFEGAGIRILSGSDANQANQYVDCAIPTGLDHARNAIVAQLDARVAVGGALAPCPRPPWLGLSTDWQSAWRAVCAADLAPRTD
jgi:uncharacterized protein (TIGR00725 family)